MREKPTRLIFPASGLGQRSGTSALTRSYQGPDNESVSLRRVLSSSTDGLADVDLADVILVDKVSIRLCMLNREKT
jgi:hypothetical protein